MCILAKLHHAIDYNLKSKNLFSHEKEEKKIPILCQLFHFMS